MTTTIAVDSKKPRECRNQGPNGIHVRYGILLASFPVHSYKMITVSRLWEAISQGSNTVLYINILCPNTITTSTCYSELQFPSSNKTQ